MTSIVAWAAPAARKGFTLVEILITMAVLSIGCLAVLRMQTASLRGGIIADNLTSATFLAEAEMERLKSLDSAQMAQEVSAGTVTVNGLDRLGRVCSPATPAECSNNIYTMPVEYFEKLPTSMSCQVDITVAWSDTTGPHSVRYSGAMTYLSF